MAYDELTDTDQNILAKHLPATTEPLETGRARTKEILDQVIKATELQYKENQRKDGIREMAQKILNCVLSFQDVVKSAVRFDPTGYASRRGNCGQHNRSGKAGTRTAQNFNQGRGVPHASLVAAGDWGSASKLFPTIVKQLATHIAQIIDGFDKLLLQPLLSVGPNHTADAAAVIVIDALDECDREDDVELILELLPKVDEATNINIRFFLTADRNHQFALGLIKSITRLSKTPSFKLGQ
ncbi:uncharacterized protein N7483_012575 [Penicillium malachiteum]|uniref:uncharacterized protein n=1 Tax=Penicillium malachiteum TaxID=1324776 RepID=UPI0025486D48|nr:uncharacterized protein N7483_012575 [Penicillium malachiteum]KAJ5715394.1 hypothetical protein N7483_012575 [Penicillium malachiteum]